jgi:hypothetical protein
MDLNHFAFNIAEAIEQTFFLESNLSVNSLKYSELDSSLIEIVDGNTSIFNIEQNERGYFIEGLFETFITTSSILSYRETLCYLIGQISHQITHHILCEVLDDCYLIFNNDAVDYFSLEATYSEDNLIQSLMIQEPITGIPRF